MNIVEPVQHLAFINVSGCSVNPARSLGPAVFVGGTAIQQLWLYLVVPTVAGAASGWLGQGEDHRRLRSRREKPRSASCAGRGSRRYRSVDQ